MLVNQDIEKIEENLYCIKECDSVNRYVIVGEKHALLIDTGYGYVDFRQMIQTITDKPLIVVLTHGHPDHGLGAYLFDEVWLHQLDYDYLINSDHQDKEKTTTYRLNKMPKLLNQMNPDIYNQPLLGKTNFKFFKEKDQIDLGGICLKIIEIPGHSKGSVAFYCEENGWLFTGDSVADYNIFYVMDLNVCEPLRIFNHSLKKLNKLTHLTKIFPAHGPKPIQKDIIQESIDGLEDLMKNYADDEEIQTFMGKGYRHIYKRFHLLYSKEIHIEALENGIDD